MNDMPLCANCRFFSPGAVHRDGLCRAEPPSVYQHPHQAPEVTHDDNESIMVEVWDPSYVGWPEVNASDWCGAFRPAGEARSMAAHPSSQ